MTWARSQGPRIEPGPVSLDLRHKVRLHSPWQALLRLSRSLQTLAPFVLCVAKSALCPDSTCVMHKLSHHKTAMDATPILPNSSHAGQIWAILLGRCKYSNMHSGPLSFPDRNTLCWTPSARHVSLARQHAHAWCSTELAECFPSYHSIIMDKAVY